MTMLMLLTAGSNAVGGVDEATSRDLDDDVTDDVSLGEEPRHDTDSSSDDVTAHYPAEVIVEGQQMNKVGHV